MMKNILKRITTLLYKDNSKREEKDRFYPMNIFPPRDGIEPFSITVIVYDEYSCNYFDLGYYDYEEEKWKVLNEEEMDLKCWCYVPDSSNYLLKEEYVVMHTS